MVEEIPRTEDGDHRSEKGFVGGTTPNTRPASGMGLEHRIKDP